ncbi:helix-turn-helix domain-containing protein [Streptomyces sp. NPDC002073]
MTQSVPIASELSLPSPKERRRLREAGELSHDEIAEAVGVTATTVRSWETGRTEPRGRKREAYAKLLADLRSSEGATDEPQQPAGEVPADGKSPEGAAGPADGKSPEDAAGPADGNGKAAAGADGGPGPAEPKGSPDPERGERADGSRCDGEADRGAAGSGAGAARRPAPAPPPKPGTASAGTRPKAAVKRAAKPPAGQARHDAGRHDAPHERASMAALTAPVTGTGLRPAPQPAPSPRPTPSPASPATPAPAAGPLMTDPRIQDPRIQDPRTPDPRTQDPRTDDPQTTGMPAEDLLTCAPQAEVPSASVLQTGDQQTTASRAEVPLTAVPAEAPQAAAPGPATSPPATSRQAAPGGIAPAQAFDALYAYTAHSLARQTYLLTGRRALAVEAVERAFQQAWQQWPDVATDRDPVGWVRAAAYEYALSPWHRFRRARRHGDKPPAELADRALLKALLALPPRHRRTVLLYDGVGLDLPDTAAETEATTVAAGSRLLTAHGELARRLPELAQAPPGGESVLLRERFGGFIPAVRLEPGPAAAVRGRADHRGRFWTRAAVALTAVIAAATAYTAQTAPTRYEPVPAPGAAVTGVPPHMGPQRLTEKRRELREKLRSEPAPGPERLVPETG